MIVREGWKLDC